MPLKHLLFLLLPALLQGCASAPSYRRGADFYNSFSALATAHAEGRDYSREVYERGALVAVFAIHGGDIEPGTALLARQVADKDLNLYIFNGWLGPDSGRLHVTATRFDDPAAVRLATSSLLGVSLHAQAERGLSVCVGGRNASAARLIVMRLESAGFAAETPCARLPGTAAKNIVNLPETGGVQLEITTRLLGRLERSQEDLHRFAGALRLAIFESLEQIQRARSEAPRAAAGAEETTKQESVTP